MPWAHNNHESPIASLPWTAVPPARWWDRPILLALFALTLAALLGAVLGIGGYILVQKLFF